MPAAKDYEAIKQTVYLYGGVESSLYMDFDDPTQDSAYYSREYSSYGYTGEEAANHDVVIIGWDDDYPAENFTRAVAGDGAFICQNSWGESFGEDGIFYVSYYDTNIGNDNVAYTGWTPGQLRHPLSVGSVRLVRTDWLQYRKGQLCQCIRGRRKSGFEGRGLLRYGTGY